MKLLALLLTTLSMCFSALHADMVTLRTNDTYYGSIVRMNADQLVLSACLPNQAVRKILVPRATISRLEFNEQLCNEDEPPQAFGAHSSPEDLNRKGATPPNDNMILFSGESKSCSRLVVDEKSIACDSLVLDRGDNLVWRVNLSGR